MTWLADAVLIVHSLVAIFIVGGLVAIWAGAGLGQAWVRQRAFRLAHLAAIVVVAALALAGLPCPLTVLEDRLRGAPGIGATQGFIQRWVGHFLYYDFPAQVFTLVYAVFALLVIATWYWIRPHRRSPR